MGIRYDREDHEIYISPGCVGIALFIFIALFMLVEIVDWI
jgi:hypothetical protein